MNIENQTSISQFDTQSDDAIFYIDIEQGIIIEANERAEKLFERNRQEIIGTYFIQHIHPAEVEDAHDKWEKVRNGSHEVFQRILVKKDGTSLISQVDSQLVVDQDNEPIYIKAVLQEKKVDWGVYQDHKGNEFEPAEFQRKLHALHELTFDLYKCKSVDELCFNVVKLGLDRLGFERLGLLFFDEGYQNLEGVYGSDESGGIRSERNNVWKLHPDSRELKLINQTMRAKYWENTVLRGAGKPVGRGWDILAVLWDGNKGIGLLSTDNFHSGKPVKPYAVDLMALYGNLVGHLISQKRNELEVQRYLDHLRLLQVIDRRIVTAQEPKLIAEEIIFSLKETLECDYISIKQYDAESGEFSLLADTSGSSDMENEIAELSDDEIPLKAIRLGENTDSVVVQESEFALISDWIQKNAQANTFIPMRDDYELLGVINIGVLKPRRLNAKQSEIAHQVAVRFAAAIRQSRLSKQLQLYTHHLEELVEQRTYQLELKAEELEAFTYSVSHDLRSPLRAIDGFSRTLVNNFNEDLPDKARHYLNRVQHNAIRMGQMIDDLLDLSRVGRKELKRVPVDLNEIIEDILTELEANNQRGNATIKVDPLPACSGDRSLLRLALFNLISNGIKYSRNKKEPKIEISCFNSEDETPIYTIKDNGVGFDMKYADKLFGVFQRLHNNREYEGNGIGLVTVHRIIEKHGEEVWAEAEVDQGATFFFTFQKRAK